MGVLAQPSGGWFQDGVMQVDNSKGRTAIIGGVVAIAFASLVGTGGISDSNFWHKRQSRGYSVRDFQGVDTEAVQAARTPAESLVRIREILKPAVSDLATLFGVSRQAIYNWQAGEQPKPEHLVKLEGLARAADIIAAEGLPRPSQLLKRKISNGRNLLDIVRAGGTASEAAQSLVRIVRREEQQRKLLGDRLAGRKRPLSDYADMGVPMLDEQG